MNTDDRFTVIIEPDGSVAVTWKLNNHEQADPNAAQSALLDRKALTTQMLVEMLRGLKAGAR